jgi:hypothetical protein
MILVIRVLMKKIFKMSTKRHLTVIKIQANLESRKELPIGDIS